MNSDLPTQSQQRTRLVEWGAGIVFVVVALAFYGWPIFCRFGVKSDLAQYHRAIRECKCPLQEKVRLLDQIDWLRDEADQGNIPSGRRWIEFDAVMQEILKDGITEDEVVFIEREITRLRREMEPKK